MCVSVCGSSHMVLELHPPHKPPTCMLLWGAPTKSLKYRIPNSGVLKTSRADGPHLQMCVWGGGVKPQGSEKGHPRGVRDHSDGGGPELEPEGKGGERRGRGGEGAARGGLGHCLLEFGSL